MCCCDFVPKTNPVFSFHSVLSDDYELSRNISSSMENLLFIASPDSAFERTISVTASLPGYGLSSAPPHDKTHKNTQRTFHSVHFKRKRIKSY